MSAVYEKKVWNQYAQAFLAVMPSTMLELNKAVANRVEGNVCDFGCGAAKISPFVLNNPQVSSYTGIDFSSDMVEMARWHIDNFPEKPSRIIQDKIECIGAYDIEGIFTEEESVEGYDSGLSINSYYAWEAPEIVLQCINKALRPNAIFILVTPNPQLDIVSLLDDAERELIANPYFESFKEQNLAIAANDNAHLIEMDYLIEQVRGCGFKVVEANQKFYDKGLNYLHLTK